MSNVTITPYLRPGWRVYTTDTTDINQAGGTFFAPNFNLVTIPPTHFRGQHDREDFNLAMGIDATWTPIKYLSVSADFNAANDYSNNSGLSYNQTSPSVSLSGSYKF